jgi:hypothetical protein
MPTIGKDIAFFAPFVAYHAVDREALTFFRDRSVASTQICADPIIGARLKLRLLHPLWVIGLAHDGGFGLASELTWRV